MAPPGYVVDARFFFAVFARITADTADTADTLAVTDALSIRIVRSVRTNIGVLAVADLPHVAAGYHLREQFADGTGGLVERFGHVLRPERTVGVAQHLDYGLP